MPTAFGKVGVAQTEEDWRAGPTVRWLVEREDGYRDTTTVPLAVVHVNNNYYSSHEESVHYAAVSSGPTAR